MTDGLLRYVTYATDELALAGPCVPAIVRLA
jgi:hypothetical protein